MKKKNIEVLLVDGDTMTRRRLRSTLEVEEGLKVRADCGSAEEAFEQVRTLSPDVILMNMRLPGIDGIEATRRMKRKGSSRSISVVLLAECGDYLSEAMEAGAAAYLPREMSSRWLAETVKGVYRHDHLPPQSDCLIQEVELSLPLLVDAGRLLTFINKVQEVLHATIVGTVGSQQGGTGITIVLPPTTLANILDKLGNISDVEKVEVGPPGKDRSGVLKKFMPGLRSRGRSTRKLLVTLKRAQIVRQEPALSLA